MKYTLGSGVSQFKGSTGGITFQKCGKVFAARKRAIPVQKNTAKQMRSRNGFQSQAGRWKTYTAGQKNSWITNAPLYTRVNSLGNTYTITGMQLNVSANQRRLYMNLSQVATTSAPIVATPINLFSAAIDRVAHTMTLWLTPDTVQNLCNVNFYVTRCQQLGALPGREETVFLGTRSQGNLTSTFNWYNTYVALFGSQSVQTGLQMWVIADVVQRSSGQTIYSITFACPVVN